MQTENDTPKPEDQPKQETGEGCSGATCSALWNPANTAPRDKTILAFFEDFGWYPAAWSADDAVWKSAKCVGRKGVRQEEPEWHEITFTDDELCWWRPWPSNRWQDCPQHNPDPNRPCEFCGEVPLSRTEREYMDSLPNADEQTRR